MFQAHSFTRFHQQIKDVKGKLGWYIKFPAQFAHIGHAQRLDQRIANINLLHGQVGKGFVRHIRMRQAANKLARFWPLDIEDVIA